jgi:beta-fructofuranosidase
MAELTKIRLESRPLRSRLGCASLLTLLTVATAAAAATEKPDPAFSVHLEGVEFDYPGAEHWAEVERPDSTRLWAFAIYHGQSAWTVPIPAGKAGAYRLLRMESRRGEQRAADMLMPDSQLTLEVKQNQTVTPRVEVEKGLVEVGEFKTIFAADEPWCINDHTFAQGPDKTWHLFGITHPKPLDFFRDPGLRLAHATAQTLRQFPWKAQPPAVTRDWEKYREYLLWAPYVLRYRGTYYMYVCVGDKDTHRYAIHLLTSPDLQQWTRSPDNPMLVDGFDARDFMVMPVGDHWVLYYTATTTLEGGNHVVACVISRDLVHWADRRVVFIHPRAGTFGGPTESPFVVRRGDHYYLFVCDGGWTDVYLSHDPLHWEFDQRTARVQAHASEIVREVDGRWYLSRTEWTEGPVQLAPLSWHDGQDDAPTNIAPGEN